MGDYMFMLESHLNPAQNRVVKQVQQIAAEAGFNIYITGGAMRDMIGGFPIRNLDFTMEGKTLKIAKKLTDSLDAQLVRYDNTRHIAHLLFPGDVTVRISMARKETYPKAGGPPKVAAATIHEDLLGRDFTVNAIALSLNAASLGLLIDPANGVADIERRELSTTYNYSLYDDPIRMLRLIRYKIRLGYEISEKTLRQLENARLAGVEAMIPAYKLRTELRHIANDPHCATIFSELEERGFYKLFHFQSKLSRGALTSLGKFAKIREMMPPDLNWECNYLPVFLNIATEGYTPKQKARLIEALELEPEDIESWQKLPASARRLEKKLVAIRGTKPEDIYLLLSKSPGEEVVQIFVESKNRLTQDRIRNFFQKYLWVAQEIMDPEVIENGGELGTPKFEKVKAQLIAKRLRARPKKMPVEGDFGLPGDLDDEMEEEDGAGSQAAAQAAGR
ncbi:MAG: hypothetical protein IT170_17645 [Bryobacterales bacterium]|nr:hypothetical protein [Bryobacterales bacterium]